MATERVSLVPRLDERQFRALAETTPDAIVTADASGRITFLNPAGEQLFGHRAADVVGEFIAVLMPAEFRAGHDAGFARFIETGRGRLVGTTVEVVAMDIGGRRFPIELSLGSVGEGAERTLTAVIRDVTDRRRRERHLEAQLAVTRVLASPLPAKETARRAVEALTRALGWDVGALWLLGDDGRLRVHHVWQAEPELTEGFVRASKALQLGRGEGLPGQALAAGAPVWHDDLTALSGFVRTKQAQAAGLRSAICLPLLTEGRAIGVIECFTRSATLVDDKLRDLLMTVAGQVSEHVQRVQTEERLGEAREHFARELARSNDELEHFAQVAAHDLHTPLRTVSGFAELLAQHHGDALDQEARDYLDQIIVTAQGSGRLLDRLLLYARVGATKVLPEPLDTQAIVSDVLAALDADISRRDAEIRVGALPAVSGDRVLLTQLMQNLVANAIKFCADDSRPVVAIDGRSDSTGVHITVTDNGIGIAPEDADRLFAMFSRGSGGSGFAGAGIGLAVCAKIVERHAGRIWAEPGAGGGSVFHVELPRPDGD